MSKDVLKLALEVLEYWDVHGKLHQPTEEAITAIKQALEQPVPMRMPKVGDRVVCIDDESLGTVVYLTAGGSPEIKFDDGSHGTYMLREFAELFGYTTPPAAHPATEKSSAVQPAPVQEPLTELQKDAVNLLFALHDAWPYVHGYCTIESKRKAIQALMVKHGDFADLQPPAAQPAPVQPVGVTTGCASHEGFFTIVFRSNQPISDGTELYTTPPAQEFICSTGLCHYRKPLTAREIELIDGMIKVQLDHAKQCDSIANRTMADKQKGWDMERVALLQKLKELNA